MYILSANSYLSMLDIPWPPVAWHYSCKPIGMSKHKANRHLIESIKWIREICVSVSLFLSYQRLDILMAIVTLGLAALNNIVLHPNQSPSPSVNIFFFLHFFCLLLYIKWSTVTICTLHFSLHDLRYSSFPPFTSINNFSVFIHLEQRKFGPRSV